MTDPSAITITRVFDAPIERVWREWTEPERFADWFGGPDVSVAMHAGGRAIDWHGAYQAVDPPSRLVFTITDQPPGAEYAVITVELRELGGGRTEMQFEQRGGGLTPEQA